MNVLLDLDGTLTDPREGIVACFRHTLRVLGRPVPPDTDLERYIGPPLRDALRELLPADAAAADVEAAVDVYRERFGSVGLFENVPFDGIPQSLAVLAGGGARLFVATSKPRVFAERILERFGMAEHFEGVYGSELDGRLSYKGALIAHALADAGLDAAETLMVGDREHDALGAAANGVYPVGVLWGFGSREELLAAGVERLVEAPQRLAELAEWTPGERVRPTPA